jgi:two-component system LytT family response regulator
MFQAYVVDDELLAIRRLNRLLEERDDVEIVGSSTSPQEALGFLQSRSIDLLFLDIMMPGMNGFELLEQLASQPMVIFTTAYDKHALRAFEVNSVDYLLKPIAAEQLDRAMRKINSFRSSGWSVEFRNQLNAIANQLTKPATPEYSDRIASRIGDRTVLIELAQISHFVSEGKLTFAVTEEKRYIIDYTLSEVERRTNAFGFQRIHRATLVNLLFIDELHRWFGGKLMVRLKDNKRTELTVSRDLIAALKKRLGVT